ncbi:MAG TPA: hypothetical protein VK846_16255 [Candidatus Limnocylindria bacterium]|nr:hypothetical protein [Candidatus Limnocylindria bacterium]
MKAKKVVTTEHVVHFWRAKHWGANSYKIEHVSTRTHSLLEAARKLQPLLKGRTLQKLIYIGGAR